MVLNVIPKDGGNDYSGEIFVTGATSDFQSDNLTQRVQDAGLSSANSLKDTYDINPSIGGPIAQDKLWFYASGRFTQSRLFAGGTYFNKNAGDPDNFFYEPDFDRQAFHGNWSNSGSTRFHVPGHPEGQDRDLLRLPTRVQVRPDWNRHGRLGRRQPGHAGGFL